MESFAADARSRNSFAGTSGSVKLSQIDSCSPDSFEEWTARLLERDGCKVLRRRGGPNDQGADVIAITPCGLRVVLQCKFSTKVKHTVDPRFFHEPFSSCVAVGFDAVQDEDGLHDRGRSAWAAAQLD
ncbi:restriction endonuclease, partial [Micromonospora aurantiaca]